MFRQIYIIVGRVFVNPLFYEDPFIAYPLFQIFSTLSLASSPPTSITTALFIVLFLWLNGLSHHIWYFNLLNDIMDPPMQSRGTLVPEGTCCVFYAKHQVYWGLTQVVFCWFSDLILHTQTHTQIHTTYSIEHTYIIKNERSQSN